LLRDLFKYPTLRRGSLLQPLYLDLFL
jgi:hypothetical protein